jgi:hypothetical protein
MDIEHFITSKLTTLDPKVSVQEEIIDGAGNKRNVAENLSENEKYALYRVLSQSAEEERRDVLPVMQALEEHANTHTIVSAEDAARSPFLIKIMSKYQEGDSTPKFLEQHQLSIAKLALLDAASILKGQFDVPEQYTQNVSSH